MTAVDAALAKMLPEIALDGRTPPDEHIVSALLWVAASSANESRYLMQLRDNKPGLRQRNHWALFGGHVEPGEDGETALVREIEEELAFRPTRFRWYYETIAVLPRSEDRVVRKAIYLVPISEADVAGMVLGEGADMRLFTLDELLKLPNIAPADLAVVMTHVRERRIYWE